MGVRVHSYASTRSSFLFVRRRFCPQQVAAAGMSLPAQLQLHPPGEALVLAAMWCIPPRLLCKRDLCTSRALCRPTDLSFARVIDCTLS